jgi:Spy/CpxP family protein refolding chaperone
MFRTKIHALAIAAAIGMMLFAVSAALAQRGPTPEKTDRHLAQLKERLKLTDAQAEKIKAIMDESQKEAMAERDKHKGDPEAAAKFREDHRKATDEKIKAVLNDEQKKEYETAKDELRQKMQDRRGKGNSNKMGSGNMRSGGY